MPTHNDPLKFAAELKRWRQHRRYSQLDLALQAGVSQRHLSFLETGRSRPSPEMVGHLCVALALPLRSRNALLNAAGFAAAYTKEPLDGTALGPIRESLHTLVEAHNPYPAYIVDRAWNLLDVNSSAATLMGYLLPPDPPAVLTGNVLRMFLHPDGARHGVSNWPHVAAVLIDRLASECGHNPGDDEMTALYDEVSGYPDVTHATRPPGKAQLLPEIVFETHGIKLRCYTTIATLMTPTDITLEELRLEALLPADSQSAETLRQLASRE